MRYCAIIPSYRHVSRLAQIGAALRAHGLDVLIVDDGNAPADSAQIAALHAPEAGTCVIRRAKNGGKGAAILTGFSEAIARGYSHALQIDADGQHDLADVPGFLAASRAAPAALICGQARYDLTVPKARRYGRYITHFWVWVETASFDIQDSLCGLRIYPMAGVARLIKSGLRLGTRMDFDIEIAVRLHWQGVRVISRPTKVAYPEGNVSNFQMLRDNVRISWLHLRLVLEAPFRLAWKHLGRVKA